MLSIVNSAVPVGVAAEAVRVEVHVAAGLPGMAFVGVPDGHARETRDRVRAAIINTVGVEWPQQRITVNVSGGGSLSARMAAGLDLAIAVGVLAASEQLNPVLVGQGAFYGELGLDGTIRDAPGAIGVAEVCSDRGHGTVYTSCDIARDLSMVPQVAGLGFGSLGDLVAWLEDHRAEPGPVRWHRAFEAPPVAADMGDIVGLSDAKYAMEVAAAGGHHMLMTGLDGYGMHLLGDRLVTILPDLTGDEQLEVARLRSAAGMHGWPGARPMLRRPHYGLSPVAVLGGAGAAMAPGEVSLAHLGVLYLEDVAGFAPGVVDGLREPMEAGVIAVSRGARTVRFPASVLVAASMAPCPAAHRVGACTCSPGALVRYRRRLSGPVLSQFTVRVPMFEVPAAGARGGESSETIRGRVAAARDRAAERGVRCNSELPVVDMGGWSGAAVESLTTAVRLGLLSGRGMEAVARVALTVADLAGVVEVNALHASTALWLAGKAPRPDAVPVPVAVSV